MKCRNQILYFGLVGVLMASLVAGIGLFNACRLAGAVGLGGRWRVRRHHPSARTAARGARGHLGHRQRPLLAIGSIQDRVLILLDIEKLMTSAEMGLVKDMAH